MAMSQSSTPNEWRTTALTYNRKPRKIQARRHMKIETKCNDRNFLSGLMKFGGGHDALTLAGGSVRTIRYGDEKGRNAQYLAPELRVPRREMCQAGAQQSKLFIKGIYDPLRFRAAPRAAIKRDTFGNQVGPAEAILTWNPSPVKS